MKESDESLLERFQHHSDSPALDVLLDRHLESVQRVIRRMGVHQDDVPDLVQDTFIKAIRGITSFKKESKFSTWLHRIAMNSTMDYFRKLERRKTETLPELPDVKQSCPSERARYSETIKAVDSAICSLKEIHRSAIVLTTIEGYSVQDAAAICSCTPNAMSVRLYEARRILKTILKEHLQ